MTEIGKNPSELEGIPVMELQDFAGMLREDLDNIEVLIGTPEAVMEEMEESLEQAGIHNHVRLDSRRWAEMANNAFIKSGKYLPLSAYTVGCRRAGIHIFKAIHFKDRSLKTQIQDLEYISTLQVGSADSLGMAVDFKDDTGDNISRKNGNYSELTGLYWIWKNQIGRAHV